MPSTPAVPPPGSGSPGPLSSAPEADPFDLPRGIDPEHRYRCDGCGNVTRFDVVTTATTRRFHHYDLGGGSHIEEEHILAQEFVSVTCRWCGRDDAIRVEPAPASREG